MRVVFALLLSIPLVMTGCGPSEEEVEEQKQAEKPPPPPPPTAQQIAQQIINEAQLDAPIPPPGTQIPADLAAQFKGFFQQQKNKHVNTPEGREALTMVKKRVESRIRRMEQAKSWEPLLLMCEAFDVLDPGSKKFKRQKDLAVAELQKPQITIKGIVDDGTTGTKIAILDLYMPLNQKTINDRIRVGEEKYGVKLIRVIGNNQGLLFEYRQTGETFEVLTNKATQ